MKKLYILIALLATVIGNVQAQLSPIFGGYSIAGLLSDSGMAYWSGNLCGGGCGTAISSGNVYLKVVQGQQGDAGFDPVPTSGYLERITLMNNNSGNHILAKDCNYLYAFGNGGNGQLGDGNTNFSALGGSNGATMVPRRVLKGLQSPNTSGYLENVINVSTGNLSSYAVISDGTVMSWGDNSGGRLGDGSTTDRTTPVYVLTSAGVKLTGVIQVSGLEDAAVALKSDGTVWAWGQNTSSATGSVGTSSYAAQVAGLPNPIVKIEGGDFNVLALDNQGYLWNWGKGNTLGDGTNGATAVPTRVLAPGSTYPSTNYLTDVVDMAAGQTVCLALLSNGKVVSWGSDGSGEQGTNGGGAVLIPEYVLDPAGTDTLDNIAFIGSGDAFAMAMKLDGTLYTWGKNSDGQLGLGSTTSKDLPTMVSKSYKIKLPCPVAYLGPDVTLCNPISENLYAGDQGPTFKYEWYKDGVLVTTATAAFYTVNTPGTYKVVITDTASFYICTPCTPTEDQIVITTSSVAPVNATFCPTPAKSVSLSVSSGLTTFDWYAASTGGSPLVGGTNTNTYTTPAISATTTYYVEDTRIYSYTNASGYLYDNSNAVSGLVLANNGSLQVPMKMLFTVTDTLTLVSLDVFKTDATGCTAGSISNVQIKFDNLSNATSQTKTFNLTCGAVTTVAIGFVLYPGNYSLTWVTSVSAMRNYSSAVYPRGITGLISFYDDASNFGIYTSSFFNWNLSAKTNCARIPVVATAGSCTTPVNFLSFGAEKINNDVHLNWTTAELGGNQFFEIERSLDGINFDVVGKVDAKTDLLSSYSFVDHPVPAGILYYRIKQYDQDGQFMYSVIRNITDNPVHEVSVFPNPSDNNFNLLISDAGNREFKGEIYTSIGTKVETINGTTNNAIHFGNTLPSGCYLLKLMVGNDAPAVIKICKR
jgi:alpha-tubulin suppressor-like RCC1 family protein